MRGIATGIVLLMGGCNLYFGDWNERPDASTPLDARPAPGDSGPTDAGQPTDEPAPTGARTLVSGLASPSQIVLDQDYLYWVNATSQGSVMRVPTTGGAPTVLASGQVFPVSLIVDASDVYWTNTGIGEATGSVMRVGKTGGQPVVVARELNWPIDLAGDRDFVYWRDNRLGLQRAAKRGGPAQLLVASPTLSGVVAVDDTRVYFEEVSSDNGPGRIRAIAKAGGPVADVATLPNWFLATLVVEGGDVFWHNGGVDSLWRAPTAGGAAATAVFANGLELRSVVPRGDSLFITTMGEPFAAGGIYEVSRAGGRARLVTPHGVGLWGLAVDDRAIYWTNLSDGTVNAISR